MWFLDLFIFFLIYFWSSEGGKYVYNVVGKNKKNFLINWNKIKKIWYVNV